MRLARWQSKGRRGDQNDSRSCQDNWIGTSKAVRQIERPIADLDYDRSDEDSGLRQRVAATENWDSSNAFRYRFDPEATIVQQAFAPGCLTTAAQVSEAD